MEQSMELTIGNNAPDFSLPIDSGEILSLSEFFDKKMWFFIFILKTILRAAQWRQKALETK